MSGQTFDNTTDLDRAVRVILDTHGGGSAKIDLMIEAGCLELNTTMEVCAKSFKSTEQYYIAAQNAYANMKQSAFWTSERCSRKVEFYGQVVCALAA